MSSEGRPGRPESGERRSLVTSGRVVAAMLAVAFGLACGEAAPEAEPAPVRDVLLVTVDTLRPDFLSTYGFAQPSSPNVDALAERGVVFENAIAAASLTAPAHASIMTGRFARQHSVGPLNGESRLDGLPTLAERFRDAGYRTGAFISNVVLRRRVGLDRGFDVYDDELPAAEQNRRALFERPADATAGRALDWIAQNDAEPIFVWLHLQDPHGPYNPPEGYRGRFEDVPLRVEQSLPILKSHSGRAGIPAYQALEGLDRPGQYAARYAEEVLFADRWIGQVVEAMRARRGGDEPIVLLTSDHGESMGEGAWFFQHGQSATPDLARVPFVVVAPGVASRREEAWVSHVDVAPTLLDLAGVDALGDATGVSLEPLLHGDAGPGARVLFCDTEGESAAYTEAGIVRAVGGMAFAVPQPGARPLEMIGMVEKAPGVWRPRDVEPRTAEALIDYLEAAAPLSAAGVMEPEHIEQLRALGYVEPLEDEPAPAAGADAARETPEEGH